MIISLRSSVGLGALVTCALLSTAGSASAKSIFTVADWNFNDVRNSNGGFNSAKASLVDIGVGTGGLTAKVATDWGGTNGVTSPSTPTAGTVPVGNGDYGVRLEQNKLANFEGGTVATPVSYFSFSVNTTATLAGKHYSNVGVSWDQWKFNSSGQDLTSTVLEYNAGAGWKAVGVNGTIKDENGANAATTSGGLQPLAKSKWQKVTYDLSGIQSLNNNASVQFRLAALGTSVHNTEPLDFIGFDNVLVTAAIPEPGTVALMVLGLIAVVAMAVRGRNEQGEAGFEGMAI